MYDARIVIADSREAGRRVLRDMLVRAGYKVQAEATNAPDLLRKTRTLFPDLVILDANLEGGSAVEIAGIIDGDNICSILVITDNIHKRNMYDYPHLIRPYNEETLLSVVEVCLLYNNRFSSLKREMERLKDTLNSRKLIERAKGILMKNTGMGEEEAYRKMQKQSMDTGISMKELAKAIIAQQEKQ